MSTGLFSTTVVNQTSSSIVLESYDFTWRVVGKRVAEQFGRRGCSIGVGEQMTEGFQHHPQSDGGNEPEDAVFLLMSKRLGAKFRRKGQGDETQTDETNAAIDDDTDPLKIRVRNGDRVVVVDDPSNPRLTVSEGLIIEKEIVRYRERGLRMDTTTDYVKGEEELDELLERIQRNEPLSKDEKDEERLWSRLIKDLDKPFSPWHLKRHYLLQPHLSLRTWTDLYEPMVPRVEAKDLARLLLEPFDVHVYWRAPDRAPGGECADSFTIRYVLHLHPDSNKNSVVAHIANLEGYMESKCTLTGPWEPANIEMPEHAHQEFRKLLLAQDSVDSTFHIFDNDTTSSQDDDQEWSSVEILVWGSGWDPNHSSMETNDSIKTMILSNHRVAKKAKLSQDLIQHVADHAAPKRILLRLHQQCLMGPQYSYPMSRPQQPEPVAAAAASQQQLVDLVTEIVGMRRVKEWNYEPDEVDDEEDSDDEESYKFQQSRAGSGFPKSQLTDNKVLGRGHEQPFYFRF